MTVIETKQACAELHRHAQELRAYDPDCLLTREAAACLEHLAEAELSHIDSMRDFAEVDDDE